MNYLLKQGETCKSRVKTQLQDKRVAGYINHNDRPDSVLQYNRNFKPLSETDRANKNFAADLLQSID